MQLYIIRHLPTTWNIEGKLQGKKNIPIATERIEEYKEQIVANKNVLEPLKPFDVVLASSLIRTQQTAAVYGYEPLIEPLLDELDFGPYEGKPKVDLIEDYHIDWYENPSQLVLGESIKSLQDRVQRFLLKYKDCKNALVFGHGSWIRALISMNETGEIQSMNQITLHNNQLIHLEVVSKVAFEGE